MTTTVIRQCYKWLGRLESIATNQLVTPRTSLKEVVDQDGLVVVPERIEPIALFIFRDENVSPFFARRWSDYRTMSQRVPELLFKQTFPSRWPVKTGTAEAFNR